MARRQSQVRRPPHAHLTALLSSLSFTIALGCWWLAAAMVAARHPHLARFIPGPGEVFRTISVLLSSPDFWNALWVSNRRVLVAFAASAILGVPLGVWIGAFPRFRGLAGPITDFARYVPVAAIVPAAVLTAGTGEEVKVLILFLGTFFQLVVMVSDVVLRVPIEYIESALTLGAKTRSLLWRVLAPAAGPGIYDAMRVSIGFTWGYLTIAELVAAERGLGQLIIHSQRFLRSSEMFAVIVVLGTLGLVYDRFFVLTRNRFFGWSFGERED